MDMLMRWIMVVVAAVVLTGLVYHHPKVWGCEGMDMVSGKIVVGDSVEDVVAQLNQREV